MITPKTPPGFNELLPREQRVFNTMIDRIRMTYERHGYTPLETSAIELAQILLAKEGGETAKQVYRFIKGDTDLALRFDLTVPLARYVAEHYHELTFPFRRYQIQEVWRAEKPQAGRYRQFYQCDVDILGSNNVTADADVLITTFYTLQAISPSKAVLHISNRKIIAGFLQAHKLEKKGLEIMRIIDKLAKQGLEKTKQDLINLGIKNTNLLALLKIIKLNGSASNVLSELSKIKINNDLFTQGLNELEKIKKLLQAGGLKPTDFVFNMSIVRGLDYYTGMVFETILTNHKTLGSIASGGRYDNLVSQYRKEAIPGVGASIGVSRLFSLLKEKTKQTSATPAQALVVVFNESLLPYCFKVASLLRAKNINVEVYPSLDKPGKQIGYADKIGIPLVLLCGEDEEKKNMVTIKNMKTGKQKTVSLTKMVMEIQKIIS